MRKAFELAFSTAHVFSSIQPAFKAVDEITFVAPVSIGDIVCFTSEVVFTDNDYIQVSVAADVISPQTKERKTTNVFHFTFLSRGNKKKVYPYSYEDAIKMADGRRKMIQ